MTSREHADISIRLDRIKKLCDELDEAQHDSRRYRQLIERIREEADFSRHRLATHDRKPGEPR